ncbi:MAG: AI-2E family transporter [Bacteroidota bacterium]
MDTIKLPFYARLALVLFSIVLILFLITTGKTLFIPLFFALLIAVLLYPLVHLLEKWHLGRGISAMIAILLFMLVGTSFIYFFSIQIANFSQDLPELQKRVTDIFHQLQHWVNKTYHIDRNQQSEYISNSTNSLISTLVNSLGNTLLTVTDFLVYVIFITFYTFFILFYRKMLKRFILALFKTAYRAKVNEVVNETRTVINSYVLGLVTEMVILIIVNCSIFTIMGIKYALLLGMLAAVLNIIPYLGIYMATVIAMIVTFANSGGTPAIEVGVALMAIHFVDANIMMPRIVGKRVNINPFITIIAVIAGNIIWGIPGMFLFIPLTAIIKIICERVEDLRPWAILIGVESKD